MGRIIDFPMETYWRHGFRQESKNGFEGVMLAQTNHSIFPLWNYLGFGVPTNATISAFIAPELPIFTWKSRDFLVPLWTFIYLFLIIFIKLILGANFLWPFTRGRSYDLKKIIKFLKNILKKIIFIAYLGTISWELKCFLRVPNVFQIPSTLIT